MLRTALIVALATAAFNVLPAQAADTSLDFTGAKSQKAASWLESNGFTLERDAADSAKTKLTLTDKGLKIDSLAPSQALLARKKGPGKNYQTVELEWGVNKFPPGASYAKGHRNEAIMFYAFFGEETVESGMVGVPDMPYFLALHLCENDAINQPEKGEFYHKGGRFICVAHPKPGELVKTSFDLKKAFKDTYGFDAPPLSGIALEYDTTNAKDDGTTSAFVSSIRFPAGSGKTN